MEENRKQKTAVFIMPRSSKAWRGAEALWITVAGWAAVAEKKWGHAIVATTDTIATAKEALIYPLTGNDDTDNVSKWKSPLIPDFAVAAYKDWKLKRSQPAVWPVEKDIDWDKYDVQFIWEQHDLFYGPGWRLSKKLKVPFILYVHAPVVWETAKWGVKRPVWGNWLENKFEATSLKRADWVACVSEEVKEQVIKMGVNENKISTAPMSVDGTFFNTQVSGDEVRKKYQLENNMVVGWTGSFRSFHGLDTVVKAFKLLVEKFPAARLMLVGEGFEKESTEALAASLGVKEKIIFTGKQSVLNIPSYIAAFDVALVSTKSASGFHYFPLKLREYLAMGKATIAPAAGDIPLVFTHKKELLFYNPGDVNDLVEKISFLLVSEKQRRETGEAGRQSVLQSGLWEHVVNDTLKKLGISF